MAETTGGMTDIDLRFIVRSHPTWASNPLGPQTVTRTLQWRKRFAYPNGGWTEWQDVPAVVEAGGGATGSAEPSP